MASDQKAISVADLQHNGVRFRPAEAVTLVRELVRRVAADELPGIPSPHVTRLHADGDLSVEGPVAASHDVQRAARLLDSMVPGFDSTGDFRVSGPLRLVIMRALGTLDLPPYRTLGAFRDALERFGSNDTPAVVRALFAQHAADAERTEEHTASEVIEIQPSVQVGNAMSPLLRPGHITISDLRRARRSTGVSLIEIAHRTGMPVPRLRELEWGLLRNWPGGDAGRRQVASYARAAGLDEQIVLRTLGPLLEEAAAGAHDVDPNNAQPVTALVRVESGAPLKMPLRGRSRRRWLASLAVSGFLGIGLVPAWTLSRDDAPRPASIAKRSDVAPRPPAKGPDAAHSPAFATEGSPVFYHDAVLRIPSVVDGGANNFHARLSPDGSRIAFDSDRDGTRAIYVTDSHGEDVRRVTRGAFAAVPSWSPDGRSLAYARAEENHPHVWNLWTMELESGNERRLTSHADGQPWGASWFPDGRRLAYSHEGTLIVLDTTNGQSRIYPSPVGDRLVRTPAVSPDGGRVIFQVYHDGAWVLDVASGRMRKVLADPSAEEYTWSPDGGQVAYHSRNSGRWGVWIIATE